MASTSAPRASIGNGRIASAASTLTAENQALIAEIRKAITMMKEVAVDLETDNNSELVNELENGVLELLKASDDCTLLSNAIESVKNEFQIGSEPTNFSKLFAEKIEKSRNDSSSVPQNHFMLRQFREAIWNVHHAGQPMPGDEQEDIVMTSTESNLLNTKCPITGKPVTELQEPVRSMDCKHIYEKAAIMRHIMSKASQGNCPIAGCPKRLQADRVVCDPLLLIEIDEAHTSKHSATGGIIEDFTDLGAHS